MGDAQYAHVEAGEKSGSGDIIYLNTCRTCSSSFSYSFPNGDTVTILAGIPPKNVKYKAISHVWGANSAIKMHCQKCSSSFSPRLRSPDSFRRMMAAAGSGNRIWLDTLSINQSDHKDVASQIAVMGDIFGEAECVTVFLPPSDREAYQRLEDLVNTARALLERKWRFDYRVDESVGLESEEGIRSTEKLGRQFFDEIEKLRKDLDKYVYWQRAWTFQEWAVAHDIELACDQPLAAGTTPPTLLNIKSTIVFTALMMADYKLRFGGWALMNLGFTRGEAKPRVDSVKRMFPFEDAFASYEEIDDFELRFQTMLPGFGTDLILGLRSTPRAARTSDVKFRARLNIMLDAFAGSNERKATFEADLICCWASMCGIPYNYSKDDGLVIALTKAIRALRKLGITVYNFLVNGDKESSDVDLQFFTYAAAHQQSNAANHALLPGIPAFTGHTDSAIHFRSAVMQPPQPPRARGVSIQGVEGALIRRIANLSDRVAVKSALTMALSGLIDGIMFTDVLQDFLGILDNTPQDHLGKRALVIAAIPTAVCSREAPYFFAWAICPSTCPFQSLFVAREKLNGTLVLAAATDRRDSNIAYLVAYLTLTDHQSGTFLIKVNPEGQINMIFKTPLRSDMVIAENVQDRRLLAQLRFADYDARRRDRIPAPNNASGIVNNDPVIQPFGENVHMSILESLSQRLQKDENRELKPLSIDITGHPHLIPPAQRAEEEALRLKAAVPREENRSDPEKDVMLQITHGNYNFWVPARKKSPQSESVIGAIQRPEHRRTARDMNANDLNILSQLRFSIGHHDQGIPPGLREMLVRIENDSLASLFDDKDELLEIRSRLQPSIHQAMRPSFAGPAKRPSFARPAIQSPFARPTMQPPFVRPAMQSPFARPPIREKDDILANLFDDDDELLEMRSRLQLGIALQEEMRPPVSEFGGLRRFEDVSWQLTMEQMLPRPQLKTSRFGRGRSGSF